jgi:hypothetical protein
MPRQPALLPPVLSNDCGSKRRVDCCRNRDFQRSESLCVVASGRRRRCAEASYDCWQSRHKSIARVSALEGYARSRARTHTGKDSADIRAQGVIEIHVPASSRSTTMTAAPRFPTLGRNRCARYGEQSASILFGRLTNAWQPQDRCATPSAAGSNHAVSKRLIDKVFLKIGSGGMILNSRHRNSHDIFFHLQPIR